MGRGTILIFTSNEAVSWHQDSLSETSNVFNVREKALISGSLGKKSKMVNAISGIFLGEINLVLVAF